MSPQEKRCPLKLRFLNNGFQEGEKRGLNSMHWLGEATHRDLGAGLAVVLNPSLLVLREAMRDTLGV